MGLGEGNQCATGELDEPTPTNRSTGAARYVASDAGLDISLTRIEKRAFGSDEACHNVAPTDGADRRVI